MTQTSWKNWAGTQMCTPSAYVRAESVDHIRETVAAATADRQTVRVVGSGHSFTPLICTEGIILDVAGLSGIEEIDTSRHRARVRAGSRLKTLGEPLWEAGISLKNQGDIDSQTLAGAVSTATHGSGLKYTSFSGMVTRAELVTSDGELVVIKEDDPRLGALQTSLGAFGVLTSLELQAMPAYQLVEKIEYWSLAEVLERWHHETQTQRHFQFWWGPYDGSLELYGMASPESPMKEPCYVRTYEQIPADATGFTSPSSRVDRAYRVYADEYPAGWDELEYFVPYDIALDALDEIRPVLARFPTQRYPVEVRTIAAETAWMSPMHERDSVSISVSGAVGTDYEGFLRAMDDTLRPFGGRAHWGKTHFLDAGRLKEVYPRYDEFVALRSDFDPTGTFVNPHLHGMFA